MAYEKRFLVRTEEDWGYQPGLYYGDKYVSEIIPSLEKVQHIVSGTGQIRNNYFVRLRAVSGTDYGVREVSHLKKLPYYELWGCADGLLTAAEKRYHTAKLQEDSMDFEPETIYEKFSGFAPIARTKLLVWGDEIFSDCDGNTIKFGNTKYRVRRKVNMDQEERMLFLTDQLPKYLDFWPGVTEPLFYSALYAVIKLFLNDMKLPTGHLTLLIGPPGHLKTTLAKKYCLWSEDLELQCTTFQDRIDNKKILNRVKDMAGQNFLADDLHKIPTYYGDKKLKNRLDELARQVANGECCANVIVTGEGTEDVGVFSCLDRTLQIRFPQLESEQLLEKKAELNLIDDTFMPEVARYFVTELMGHYDEVKADIQEFMASDRTFETIDNTLRVGYHAKQILLTAELFEKYCFSSSKDLCRKVLLKEALENICREQASVLAKFRDEQAHNYVKDLYQILDARDKYVKVCMDSNAYDPQNPEQCFCKNGGFYFTEQALQNAFIRYLERPVDINVVKVQLKKCAILMSDDGILKKRFAGKYHYIVSGAMLKLYGADVKSHEFWKVLE